MVSKGGLDLQRRDRSGPRRNLAPSDFFHVPAKPRQYRNSVPYLAAHGKCSRSRRLNRPKSSSEGIIIFGVASRTRYCRTWSEPVAGWRRHGGNNRDRWHAARLASLTCV